MGQLLGIEIGNSNIKFVLGTKKGRIIHVQNYGIDPTPNNAVRDGFIVDMEAVYNAAFHLLKKKHITDRMLLLPYRVHPLLPGMLLYHIWKKKN